MTTGTNVIDRLNLFFQDAASAKFTVEQKLEAVNAAIDSAWPDIFVVASDSSITLASTTYAYTPTATPEGGFKTAYATYTNSPDSLLRRVFQRQTAANTFQIMVPQDLASGFTGQTLKLYYHGRIARITLAADTIDATLPLDFLWTAAAQWLCMSQLFKGNSFEVDPYEKMMVALTPQVQQARHRAAGGMRPLPQMIPIVGDAVAPSNNRYGQGIITNP